MKKEYIGIDVHRNSTFISIVSDQGEVIHREVKTDKGQILMEIVRLLEEVGGKSGEVVVAMEAGPGVMSVARYLSGSELEVKVYDSLEVNRKKPNQYKKSDRVDSEWLAEGTRRGIFEKEVYVPSEGEARLRILFREREALVQSRTGVINRVKAFLAQLAKEVDVKKLSCAERWEELLSELERMEGEIGVYECVKLEFEQWKLFTKQLEEVEEKIREEIRNQGLEEEVELLKTIPGIGDTTAMALVSFIGDINRFPDGRHLASYFGVVPDVAESGGKRVDKGTGARGNKIIKRMLIQCAQLTCRKKSPFYPFYAKIRANRGHHKAIVAMAYKLVRIIYVVLSRKEGFSLDKLGVEPWEGVIEKRVYYRIKKRKK